MSKLNKKIAAVVEWVAALLLIGGVVGIVWVFVAAGIWHGENMAECDRIGGSYEAFDGSGQCIKDQVILFDPRHDWRER